ncbi:MAG: hypothetical protein WCS83_04765 [Endomicrobiia bacterium]|nr:hypothetical protein [Endomicrobiaceae bacterium]MDD3053968.1 hypothetical protein [Endomicrobiaceae bacterium]MDD3923282.1 hypothetical protein [Endomicrobiaceae bacterium]
MNNQNEIIEKFCELCDKTYQVWITKRTICDDNLKLEGLNDSKCVNFLNYINDILQEYMLLQIIKLHDPEKQFNHENLTLEYIVNHIDKWEPLREPSPKESFEKIAKNIDDNISDLKELKEDLDDLFIKQIKPARMKILCHNDLETNLENSNLGEFKENSDKTYFIKLQNFVNVLHESFIGGQYPFFSIAQNEAEAFLACLMK